MNLKVYKTVNYSNAGLFKLICPGNIALLIKTGLKLHKNDNLLSPGRRSLQSLNNRRITTGAVKGHFNCKNIVVVSGIAYHLYHRVITFVRNMKDFIMQFEGIPVRLVFG